MNSTDYANLTNKQQISFLRKYAKEFADEFGLDPTKIRLVQHAYNTTFRVDDPKLGSHALRINTNSIRQVAELKGEVEFVSALRHVPELTVAKPRSNRKGEKVLLREWPHTKQPMAATCYSWLTGRFFLKRPGREQAALVGRATAAMHDFAERWQLPEGAQFRTQNDILQGTPWLLDNSPAIQDHGIWKEVMARAEDAYAQLRKKRPIPIHFDLHFANMKFAPNEVQIFDFDDTVLDRPLVDAAVTFFYWRFAKNADELERIYWENNPRDPVAEGMDFKSLEAIVAGRLLFLVNGLSAINTAHLQDIGVRYIKAGEIRLSNYLKTGKYDPTVAKV
ncbi:phosphotransferase [Kamptonema cortianum]|nr:phosphotransferase [Geitlerinema splendidum]MDK3155915.1 phosphotransferase [Kamptonema cortianum]